MALAAMKTVIVSMVLLQSLVSRPVDSQVNPAFVNDPSNANANTNYYYFSSNSDCNGPIQNLYGFTATIKGNDISSTTKGPTTCTIRLRSESQFDGSVLDIEIIAMNIQECTTQVAIYDGDGANLLLRSYDCRSSTNTNRRRFQTSGDTGTFVMSRQNTENYEFDIEIKVTPIRGGTVPGDPYGTQDLFAFDKFPQEAIVGMIGGFYVLILIICIVIIIYFDRKFKGRSKKWETHQLATIKTGANFEGQMPPPSQVWSMEMQPTRPPPSYRSSTYPHSRKTAPPSEDGERDAYYNEDRFQTRRLMNEEKEKPRQRFESSNASYTEEVDDPDHFVEKVITPRVRTHNRRDRRPPSYEEAVSDGASDHSSDEESNTSSDNSVKKRPLSSEDERSHRSSRTSRTASETESEEESGSDDHSHRGRGARARKPKSKPQKSRRRRSSDDSEPSSSRQPRQHQIQPQHPQPQMQPMPYGAYPPGQFVPIMAGPPAMQPVQMVPNFPPPGYHAEQSHPAPSRPQIQPTDPPVYSYLVRRGYTPLDARSNSPASAVSSQRSGGARLEEPELRLDTGVEYMRR